MIALLTILQSAAALYVLWYALCALNSMGRRTEHGMRAAIIAIAIGTFFELARVALFAHQPDLPETLILVGLALGTHYNRRSERCPCLFGRRMGPENVPPPEARA